MYIFFLLPPPFKVKPFLSFVSSVLPLKKKVHVKFEGISMFKMQYVIFCNCNSESNKVTRSYKPFYAYLYVIFTHHVHSIVELKIIYFF